MINLKRLCACLLIAVSLTSMTMAQSTSGSGSKGLGVLPEPYTKDEFPSWLNGLRRFEIISLGVFPIVLFYTRITMDVTRFVGNSYDPVYAPWPFKNENSYAPSDDEQLKGMLIAGGVSLLVGVLDAFLLWKISLN